MKTKLLYPCGIPKPIALVMVGAILFAFCCTECLLAQSASEDDPVKKEPVYYCGCIEMVTCYGKAPEWPKALIRPIELPVSMSEIMASLKLPANHKPLDKVLYAGSDISNHSGNGSAQSSAKTGILLAEEKRAKETGNR